MVLETSHSWRLIGALFGVAVAAVATGGVVQPTLAQCGAMPTDCNTYQCNTATGEWRLTGKKVNGAACNDGNVCTTGDKCQSGACVGTPPVTNDSNACTADSYNPTTCVVAHTKLTTSCCANGVAISTNLCCNAGSPKTGTLCNDANACTRSDTCQAGVCVGANPVVCAASDQCHDVGLCNTTTGVCSNPANSGRQCVDGNACTQTDTCQAGVCAGANPVACTASDQCHLTGTCNTSTGVCSNPTKINGAYCIDGDACTQTDTCQAGVCVGANPVVCTASDQCHLVGACNSSTGACSSPAKNNDDPCNDSNACTQTDTCQAGVCVGANPVICMANDQCHLAGTCNTSTGSCSNPIKNNGDNCIDGNACTQTDTCQAGVCAGANPVVCTASDQCHLTGICNTSTGQCSNPLKQPGTLCGDTANCGCSAAGVCAFTVDRTNYCYDQAGNQTAVFVRASGATCVEYSCQ